MRHAAILVLAACAGPTAPRNRAGIVATPVAAGAEIEHFLDGDADHGSWSAGLTVGLVWEGLDALVTPRSTGSAMIVAVNPLVRYHAYRPTDWLAFALDGKLSFVWYLPDRDLGRARLALSFESHVSAAASYRWGYALLGVGVKQFLFDRDVGNATFPSVMTLPASEASVGLRW